MHSLSNWANNVRLDLHLHSSASHDSVNSPATIVRTAKRLGIGFAVTDHNTAAAWGELERLSKRHGVPFVKGEELLLFDGGECVGEMLALFIENEIKSRHYLEAVDEIHAQGGIAVLAHPFDFVRHSFKRLSQVAGRVDAVEALNARSYLSSFNKRAEAFARRKGLALVAGSDAHFPEEIGRGLTVFSADDLEGARRELLQRRTKISGRRSSWMVHFKTALAKRRVLRER